MLTRCYWVSREDVDSQPSFIKMLDVNGTASKRREKVDLGMIEQVVFLALEPRMRLLLDFKLNIAG